MIKQGGGDLHYSSGGEGEAGPALLQGAMAEMQVYNEDKGSLLPM